MMMEVRQMRVLRYALAAQRRLGTAASVPPAPAAAASKDSSALYRRLSALGGAPEGSVTMALKEWVREGKVVRARYLIEFVKDLRKYRQHRNALEVMDWMVENKGMNFFTNHAIYIDLLSKVKGIGSAEEYFSNLPESAKKQPTYGALLNCFCTEKMPDKAIPLYKKMKARGLVSHKLVQNNMMVFYMKLGHHKKVETQFQEMKSENIAPDTFTYCILMNSYAARGDIDSVERVVQEMEEADGIVLTWSAYGTLAGIYNSAGLFEKAESALKKLEQLIDSRSSREPLHFLISLYASTGNLAEVKRVWKSLKKTFPKLTNMSYLIMLQALNKLEDIDGIRQCFEEWESVQVVYDARLMNVMISAYLNKDMVEEAESVHAKATHKVTKFNFKIAELFVDYYLKNKKYGSALKWVKMATSYVKHEEWKLNWEFAKMFLKNFEEAKDVERAEEFCKILKQLKALDSRAYDSLIQIYVAAGKKEPSLKQQIEDDGILLSFKSQKLLEKVTKT